MLYDPTTGIHSSPSRRVDLPSSPLSIFDFLFPVNSTKPDDAPALIEASSSRTYTYGVTRQRTLDLSRAFHSRGVGDGDSVVIFSPNDLEYGPTIWGANRLGAVVSCANPEYMPDELSHQLDTGSSSCFLFFLLVD
jgi:4-coumarate--CoA ligase